MPDLMSKCKVLLSVLVRNWDLLLYNKKWKIAEQGCWVIDFWRWLIWSFWIKVCEFGGWKDVIDFEEKGLVEIWRKTGTAVVCIFFTKLENLGCFMRYSCKLLIIIRIREKNNWPLSLNFPRKIYKGGGRWRER